MLRGTDEGVPAAGPGLALSASWVVRVDSVLSGPDGWDEHAPIATKAPPRSALAARRRQPSMSHLARRMASHEPRLRSRRFRPRFKGLRLTQSATNFRRRLRITKRATLRGNPRVARWGSDSAWWVTGLRRQP